jgi:hypothetical protein
MAAILKLDLLRRVLTRLIELLTETSEVRYVSVPIWRPWRDF